MNEQPSTLAGEHDAGEQQGRRRRDALFALAFERLEEGDVEAAEQAFDDFLDFASGGPSRSLLRSAALVRDLLSSAAFSRNDCPSFSEILAIAVDSCLHAAR